MKQLKKTLLTLVALLAVTTGAWAQEEVLLTTINASSDFTSGSKTFDGVATVTITGDIAYDDMPGYGWSAIYSSPGGSVSVEPAGGTTISSCKFYFNNNNTYTISTAPFVLYPTTIGGSTFTIYTGPNSTGERLYSYGIKKIEVYTAAAASGPEVAWDKTTKTGTFTQPAGNVTVSVEYYPQAELTEAPTAINDVPATTDGAIVKVGTVANIGSTETAQGTVMYYVSTTALDDDALLALAADQWKADVPTAESLAEGQAYVYYYVRGNNSDTDEENFSDGDILAANALAVTIAAEPTYAVTFADGVNPEPPADPEWTASPNTGVKKGQTVTVTYTGTRKVIGVKAEKKGSDIKIQSITIGGNYSLNMLTFDMGSIEITSVTPSNATDQTFTWVASGTVSIASISADTKSCSFSTGSSTGNGSITVTANDGSGVTETLNFVVN